jgi:hypothetical protein
MSYRAFAVVLAAVLCLCSAPAVVSAEVSTSIQTSYDGTQPDADQAVQITYTISPEGDTVNNLTVDLDSTSGSFIESRSSSYTISPGGAEVSAEGRPGDRYFIRELDPSEEVTITFQVYPKQLKREELDVAVVSADYIQNGQQLSRSDTVTADLSASPWFALQASERRADSLQQQITGMRTLMFGGAGVGVLGILAAVGTLLWKRRAISGLKRDLSGELDKLATNMQRRGLDDGSTEYKEYENWRRQMAEEYGIEFTGGPGPDPGPGNPFDATDDTDDGGFGGDARDTDDGGFGGGTDDGGFGDDTGGFDSTDDDTGGFGGSDDD